MMKMVFVLPQKFFLFSRYLSFCHVSNVFAMAFYRKGLMKKIKVNLKFYDVTAWLANNCNTHITQHFEMSDFVSHVC